MRVGEGALGGLEDCVGVFQGGLGLVQAPFQAFAQAVADLVRDGG